MSGFASLTWDLDNRLRSVTRQNVKEGTGATTWNVYDFNGDRVRKVMESEARLEEQPRVFKDVKYLPLLEKEMNFNGQGEVVKSKTTSIVGENARSSTALVEMASTTEISDPKPLIRYQPGSGMETDDQGSLVTYEEYSPFGTTTYAATRNNIDAPSRYRYAKYERDTETGLDYCKARFYAPWLCRWLSADPWGAVDGPNLYAYCGNDPVNHFDPEGRCSTPKKVHDGHDGGDSKQATTGGTGNHRRGSGEIAYLSRIADLQEENVSLLRQNILLQQENNYLQRENIKWQAEHSEQITKMIGQQNARLGTVEEGVKKVGELVASINQSAEEVSCSSRPLDVGLRKVYREQLLFTPSRGVCQIIESTESDSVIMVH